MGFTNDFVRGAQESFPQGYQTGSDYRNRMIQLEYQRGLEKQAQANADREFELQNKEFALTQKTTELSNKELEAKNKRLEELNKTQQEIFSAMGQLEDVENGLKFKAKVGGLKYKTGGLKGGESRKHDVTIEELPQAEALKRKILGLQGKLEIQKGTALTPLEEEEKRAQIESEKAQAGYYRSQGLKAVTPKEPVYPVEVDGQIIGLSGKDFIEYKKQLATQYDLTSKDMDTIIDLMKSNPAYEYDKDRGGFGAEGFEFNREFDKTVKQYMPQKSLNRQTEETPADTVQTDNRQTEETPADTVQTEYDKLIESNPGWGANAK